MAYLGIRFPERAEDLFPISASADQSYEDYRVFLDHWSPLADKMKVHYETLAIRGNTRAVAIFGEQGSGKTMFARKLEADFHRSKADDSNEVDKKNLWHRMSGGADFDQRLIQNATQRTEISLVENDKRWVESTAGWLEANRSFNRIVIADNAERGYFLQGLVELDDAQFLRNRGNESLYQLAGQRFVQHCRAGLRGCLFILLTNDDNFRTHFFAAVDDQHHGLMTDADLPLPGPADKETIIRVNTNRLNNISYWYCLDRAGPSDKTAVYHALRGQDTFSSSFSAVDNAIRNSSRTGRPANKNIITLVVLTADSDQMRANPDALGPVFRTEIDTDWAVIRSIRDGWAAKCLRNARDAQFLESEWQLRVAYLGTPFLQALLAENEECEKACRRFLELLQRTFGIGTYQRTRDTHAEKVQELIDDWPAVTHDLVGFWTQGQGRSTLYESKLSKLLAGYDTQKDGFLTYRPDFVVEPYSPCAVTGSWSGHIEDIKRAIERKCHVFEFTAIERATFNKVAVYLGEKLDNYVQITREQ